MTQNNIMSSIAVYDYARNKLCDLYDSQYDLAGQAYNISYSRSITSGVKELSFTIPYKTGKTENFRWNYLKSEYLVRLIYNGETEWFIAQKPTKKKDKDGISGDVKCYGLEVSLKTKNIYKEFNDENGIGTIGDLVDKILAGTGWSRGYTDTLYEQDGVTEKIRSLNSNNKQGALGLMSTVCGLFKCFPIYKSDTKTVEIYNYNNRSQVLEGVVGQNMEALSVNYNSSDIITRLYVEGEYGDHEYIGIDSVNPTGLNYIFNFDYYREIGVFTQEHEDALEQYIQDISGIKQDISDNMALMIANEDNLNNLIGQCMLVVYNDTDSFAEPQYIYGEPTTQQQTLHVGDEVVVVKNNGTFRYATIETTPQALIKTGEKWIIKFITKAAGSLGACEVQVEAKQKEIENLNNKIATTVKPDKIAEYQAEIARINSEITTIYTQTNGLYDQMYSLVKQNNYLYLQKYYEETNDTLLEQQDDIESDFIIAMGDMLRDGYWNDKNYVAGQEQHLYDDAVERMNILSRPSVEYSFNIIRLQKEFGVPLENFVLNALFRIHDDELGINDGLFITEIVIGIDNESNGSVKVSNQDITLNANSLSELLSRMSQLSDIIEQKNSLYDRAQAISKSGTIYADRLNGQIDVLKNQIVSTVSNWYTDDQGNLIFLSADNSGAMMLSGAGFMIASEKDQGGEWVWRTFGTSSGFTADEIVAGFISADRIEAGSIAVTKVEPGFGGSIDISNNSTITTLDSNTYKKQTGITIDQDGLTISGSKYLKIQSGGSINITATNFNLDSTNKSLKIGDWSFNIQGFQYMVDSDNYVRFGMTGPGLSAYEAGLSALTLTGSGSYSSYTSLGDQLHASRYITSTKENLVRRGINFYYDFDLEEWVLSPSEESYAAAEEHYSLGTPYLTFDRAYINNIYANSNILPVNITMHNGLTVQGEVNATSFTGTGVKNNLTTTAEGYVLDARQGKILGDGKMNKLPSRITIPYGESATLDIEDTSRHMVVIISPNNNMKNICLVYGNSSGGVSHVELLTPATQYLSFTTATNKFTITNNHTSTACYVMWFPFDDL